MVCEYLQKAVSEYRNNLISQFNADFNGQFTMTEEHLPSRNGKPSNSLAVYDNNGKKLFFEKTITNFSKKDLSAMLDRLMEVINGNKIAVKKLATKQLSCSTSKANEAENGFSREDREMTYNKTSRQFSIDDMSNAIENEAKKWYITKDYDEKIDCDIVLMELIELLLERMGMRYDIYNQLCSTREKSSAFLYGGYYITPTSLTSMLKKYLKTSKSTMIEYCRKYDIKRLTDDVKIMQECYKDALLHNRLRELRSV